MHNSRNKQTYLQISMKSRGTNIQNKALCKISRNLPYTPLECTFQVFSEKKIELKVDDDR